MAPIGDVRRGRGGGRAGARWVMLGVCAMGAVVLAAAGLPPGDGTARYDAAGRLVLPADYRTWVFLSSGLDMSYTQAPAMASGHMFDSVFVSRADHDAFLATGHWPEGAVLVLENRGAATDVSINKRGLVQTAEVMGLEAHVRDSARFPGGWGFFAFDGQAPAAMIPMTQSCYACHQAHAAVDTTFVQFYPTLLPVAVQHGTLSAAYVAESSANAASH